MILCTHGMGSKASWGIHDRMGGCTCNGRLAATSLYTRVTLNLMPASHPCGGGEIPIRKFTHWYPTHESDVEGYEVLRVSQGDGITYFCAICQTPLVEIAEGLGLHRPLNGPMDHADVMIIHTSCRASSLVKMLLPQHVKRPLA